MKLLLYDSVRFNYFITFFQPQFIPYLPFQYNKHYTIQEQFPLDDKDCPCADDEVYVAFYNKWFKAVTKAIINNPKTSKGSNVRKME